MKIQFDYGWKWFQFHAAQRLTMFNYFMIIMGILATAYASFVKDGRFAYASSICFLGSLAALGFYCLDIRNKILTDLSEKLLLDMEHKIFFREDEEPSMRLPGLLTADDLENNTIRWRNKVYHTNAEWLRDVIITVFRKWIFKHKLWIRLIEAVVAVAYFSLGIYTIKTQPMREPGLIQSRKTTDNTIAIPESIDGATERISTDLNGILSELRRLNLRQEPGTTGDARPSVGNTPSLPTKTGESLQRPGTTVIPNSRH